MKAINQLYEAASVFFHFQKIVLNITSPLWPMLYCLRSCLIINLAKLKAKCMTSAKKSGLLNYLEYIDKCDVIVKGLLTTMKFSKQ